MFNGPLIVAKAQKTHGGNDSVMQINVEIQNKFIVITTSFSTNTILIEDRKRLPPTYDLFQ